MGFSQEIFDKARVFAQQYKKSKSKIIFDCSGPVGSCPGDILMLTAAIRDLHYSYPGEFLTNVITNHDHIWENNPYLYPLDKGSGDVLVIDIHYPLINQSNECQYHFIHGFRKEIEKRLNIQIEPTYFRADLHLSDLEKSWISQVEEIGIKDNFWIMVAGGKHDTTCKWWNPDGYQEIVDHFQDRITFVQCGAESDWHPKLKNVINLIGKTDLRQFIRLIYHSVGVVCPITFAMHAAAAIPMKKTPPINRPCVVIAGGREPTQWEAYPHHKFLSTVGTMPCCDNGGCWHSRCQKIGDGDKKDKENLCEFPVEIYPKKLKKKKMLIPQCMNNITVDDVIRSIESYYVGGVLKYDENKKKRNY